MENLAFSNFSKFSRRRWNNEYDRSSEWKARETNEEITYFTHGFELGNYVLRRRCSLIFSFPRGGGAQQPRSKLPQFTAARNF